MVLYFKFRFGCDQYLMKWKHERALGRMNLARPNCSIEINPVFPGCMCAQFRLSLSLLLFLFPLLYTIHSHTIILWLTFFSVGYLRLNCYTIQTNMCVCFTNELHAIYFHIIYSSRPSYNLKAFRFAHSHFYCSCVWATISNVQAMTLTLHLCISSDTSRNIKLEWIRCDFSFELFLCNSTLCCSSLSANFHRRFTRLHVAATISVYVALGFSSLTL